MTENQGRHKPVTLEDIAKLAGVHSRTVADAIKGTGRVAAATREKVLQIAKELNYVPNAAARALATGRTNTVAVLSGPLNEYYFANTINLLETHLTAHSYDMMLLHTRREARDLLSATKVSMADGVIIIGINLLTEAFLQAKSPSQPCVLIDTTDDFKVDHIVLDFGPAIEEALDLMLHAGKKRLAYVANNVNDSARDEVRLKTYLAFLEKVGRAEEIIDLNTNLPAEERVQSVKNYITRHGCPDAILCQNDEGAIHTYQAVTGLGYRIPEDVLLVGCDGLPFLEYFGTPLSTIALPMEEICETASRFLQNRMAESDIPIQRAVVPAHLVVRKSLSLEA